MHRTVLGQTALGLTGLSGTLLAGRAPDSPPTVEPSNNKQVWIASFCQEKLRADHPDAMIQNVLHAMQDVVHLKPDILCLPEVFHVANIAKRPAAAKAAVMAAISAVSASTSRQS